MTADELIDGWEAAWASGREEAFGALCAPDFHYEDPVLAEPLVGAAALGSHARRLWAAFPDARLERTGERLSDGRFLAAPCKLLGTHRGSLAGLPPTRRFVVVHCVFYCEIELGRLLRVRSFFDLYDAGRQLGVLPARGGLGEKTLLMLRGFGLRAGGEEIEPRG
ncbi:MAG: hypothetical protein QOK31_1125 [Solirubrobacteraceae bacterium]|nr:hypothetical protein [Solirubrobacteraceae bacterium]